MFVELIIQLLTHLLLKLKKFLESHISQQLLQEFLFKFLFQKVKNYQPRSMIPMEMEVMWLTAHIINLPHYICPQYLNVVMIILLILVVKKLMYQQIH